VAAVIISTSTAHAFGELTVRSHSLNSSLREGWPFYAMLVAAAGIAGVLVLIPNATLIFLYACFATTKEHQNRNTKP
jgi:hypothetical protein